VLARNFQLQRQASKDKANVLMDLTQSYREKSSLCQGPQSKVVNNRLELKHYHISEAHLLAIQKDLLSTSLNQRLIELILV
jgi:hypothetical protein